MFKNTKGIVLVTVYMVVFILISLLGIHGRRSINENSLAERQKKSTQAFYIAEAGIQKALWTISNNPGWVDNNNRLSKEANMYNNLGNGRFQVQISGGTSTKNITSSGTVSSINRQIRVQTQNSWLNKIPAAIYSDGKVKIEFDKRDDTYVDGGSMPGIYSTGEVKTKKEGEGHIYGNPPISDISDNKGEVPEGLQDGIWDAFDINALREIAIRDGTYFSGDEYNKSGKYTLPVEEGDTNGVFFFDTKGGVVFDDDAIDKENEAKIELRGTTEQMSGVIVVVGDLTIKDTKDYDFLFDGVILVLDDLKMQDSRHGRRRPHSNDSDIFIRGAVLSDNVVQKGERRRKKPTTDIKNATVEYDPSSISSVSPHWSIAPATWQEL